MNLEATEDFSSRKLLLQERACMLNSFSFLDAFEMGKIAISIATARVLPIAVEIRFDNWCIFHVSLPGSTPENDWWISRKARVVALKHHSTLYERVNAEELKVDWYKENNVSEENFAIHGGGYPLIVKDQGFVGSLIVSGLPQIEDHLLCVEVLSKFIESQKTKND